MTYRSKTLVLGFLLAGLSVSLGLGYFTSPRS
jgi:hypothetical protein